MYPSFRRTLRTLVVDRDPTRSDRVRDLLESLGVEVIQTATLSEALETLRTPNHIEAIILDLDIPSAKGATATDRIRAAAPTVAVIVLARDEQEASAREAVRAGAHGFLLGSQLQKGSVYRTVAQAVVQMRTKEELELAEGALLEAENRYRTLFDLCHDAICLVDEQGVVYDANKAAHDLLDWPEGELLGGGLDTVVLREEDRERVRVALADRRRLLDLEVPIKRAAGGIWVALSVVPRDSVGGEARGSYVFFRLLEETGGVEATPVRVGFYDPLTRLPNRSLLLDRLNYILSQRKRREGFLFAVLFVDLDGFKEVNDQFGHSVGDELLREVASRLAEAIRDEDTVGRIGGDEFVVLLAQIDAVEDATIIADRILSHLGKSFSVGGRELRVSCSIGITVASHVDDSPEELLRQADYAMYQAKTRGAGRYQIYDGAMQQHVMDTLRLDADLRQAVAEEEFVVHYQPVVAAETGEVRGFEALLRWQHPERGLLAPPEFIVVAQERGFIEAIGGWVLREVCRQLKEWRDLYPGSKSLEVSVNLSPAEFLRPDFVDDVQAALQDHEIPGESLRLELAESTLVMDPASTLVNLKRLWDLGVRVSIEDFGLGLYSWSYLGRTPVDCFKIPRSSQLAADNGGSRELQQIAHLAHCLGFRALAQGVETEEDLRACRAAGSNLAQGYLFWKPLEAKEAAELLERPQDGEPMVGSPN